MAETISVPHPLPFDFSFSIKCKFAMPHMVIHEKLLVLKRPVCQVNYTHFFPTPTSTSDNFIMDSSPRGTEYIEDELPAYTPMQWCVHLLIRARKFALSTYATCFSQVSDRDSSSHSSRVIYSQYKTWLAVSFPRYSYGSNCMDSGNADRPMPQIRGRQKYSYPIWR